MKLRKVSIKFIEIAIAVGILVVGYFTLQWYKQDSINKRYRDALAQLLQPRKDGEPNSANQVNLLKELDEAIVLKSGGDAALRQKLKDDVTSELTELFKSHSFDLSQGPNVELETMVLKNWKEYAERLTAAPKDNTLIMYKYFLALKDLGQKKSTIIGSAIQQKDGSLNSEGQADDKKAMALLQKLNFGYQKHVDLLRERPDEYNRKYLLVSFCWYVEAINNPSMVRYVFQYNEAQVKAEEIRCKEAGQLVKEFN